MTRGHLDGDNMALHLQRFLVMTTASVRSVQLHRLLPRPEDQVHLYDHDIERYWDRREHRFTVELLPGQSYIAENDELLTTVVGTGCCICVRHRESHVTAMASLLLDFGFGALRCVERCVRCLENLTEDVFDASVSDDRDSLEAWVVLGGDLGRLEGEDRNLQVGIVTTILLDMQIPVLEMYLGESRPLSVSFEPKLARMTLSALQSPSIIEMRRDLERIAKLRFDQERYEHEARQEIDPRHSLETH